MLFLAYKNLFQEKTRLLISVGGVTFSVLLMLLLQGLNVGFSNVLGQYFNTVPADLWIARTNTGNIMDASFLPLDLGPKLKAVNGVAGAKPFGMQSLTAPINGNDVQLYFISYDAVNDVGQPTKVSEGKATPGKGEIILDRIIAKTNGVKLGDSITLSGRQLKLVGYSEGTYLLAGGFAFVNKQDADSLYKVADTTNYWVVNLQPGADPKVVAAAVNKQVPGVNAHTKSHFVQVNLDVVKKIVNPVFGALVMLGALIGLAVIGLTIFTSTIEKAKEYGVLKAIGLKNRQLYIVVLEQALIAATIGFVIGAVMAYALNPVIVKAVPQFVTQLRFFDTAWIFGVTVVMAVIASYIPIRRISKIDPAEVFKA